MRVGRNHNKNNGNQMTIVALGSNKDIDMEEAEDMAAGDKDTGDEDAAAGNKNVTAANYENVAVTDEDMVAADEDTAAGNEDVATANEEDEHFPQDSQVPSDNIYTSPPPRRQGRKYVYDSDFDQPLQIRTPQHRIEGCLSLSLIISALLKCIYCRY